MENNGNTVFSNDNTNDKILLSVNNNFIIATDLSEGNYKFYIIYSIYLN